MGLPFKRRTGFWCWELGLGDQPRATDSSASARGSWPAPQGQREVRGTEGQGPVIHPGRGFGPGQCSVSVCSVPGTSQSESFPGETNNNNNNNKSCARTGGWA